VNLDLRGSIEEFQGLKRTGLGIAEGLEQVEIETNGVRLHTVLAGPIDGPPVILLHGFPEFWYGWRHQIGPLAHAGYRLIVPDQRGYNLSAKPAELQAYRGEALLADVVGLMEALRIKRASLVGHDWGAAVAWWAVSLHPDRFSTAGCSQCPPSKGDGPGTADQLAAAVAQLVHRLLSTPPTAGAFASRRRLCGDESLASEIRTRPHIHRPRTSELPGSVVAAWGADCHVELPAMSKLRYYVVND